MHPSSPDGHLTVYEFIMESAREHESADDAPSTERQQHHTNAFAMLTSGEPHCVSEPYNASSHIKGSTPQTAQNPVPYPSQQTQAPSASQAQPFTNRRNTQNPQVDILTQQSQPASADPAQPSLSSQNNTPASQTPFLDQFTTTVIGPLTVHSSQHTRLGRIVIHQDQTGRIPIAGFQELYARTYPATEVMINTGRTSGPRLYYIVFLNPDDEGARFRVLWSMADQSTTVRLNGRMVWIVVLERVEEGFVVDEVTRGRRAPESTDG